LVRRMAVSRHQHIRRGGRVLAPADDVQLLGHRLRRRLLLGQGLAPARYVQWLGRRRLRPLLQKRDLAPADEDERLPHRLRRR